MVHYCAIGWVSSGEIGQSIGEYDKVEPIILNTNDELGELAKSFNMMVKAIRFYIKKLEINATNEATLQTARQVAHDIRSPLAALSLMTRDLREVPEEQRLLIRSAVQRIEDIANDLYTKKDSRAEKKNDEYKEELSIQLISSIIESLVSEKRTQYRDRKKIHIETQLGVKSYGLFAKIKPREFKRVLSNLINNSVEAFEKGGMITVSVWVDGSCKKMDNVQDHQVAANTGTNTKQQRGSLLADETIPKIVISIRDNGKGVPKEILPKLTGKGVTFGKEKGQGLGLFYARKTIEQWGGTLKIDSKLGKGTTITLNLPREDFPSWFLSEITTTKNFTTITILDDDDSIHGIWNARFNKVGIIKSRLKHYKSPLSLNFLKGEKGSQLFLCDYELLGHEKNGLDVIEELGIAECSVLVTSHYEEDIVRVRCKRLGVKLLPKNLAGYVPIRLIDDNKKAFDKAEVDKKISVENSNELVSNNKSFVYKKVDVVLIDDNELIRSTWEIMAKRFGAVLRCFETPDEFANNFSNYSFDTPIYIDSNLSNGVKGEKVAKDLYQKGFKSIYLATGSSPKDFPDMPWIKDIVGKDPPFEEV